MKTSNKVLSFVIAGLLTSAATVARADAIDTFNETTANGQCCFKVVLDQKSSTDIGVTISTVSPGVYFANTGSGQHPTFAFNLDGVSGISLTNYDTTNWLGSQTAAVTSGPDFGTFTDQFNLISGGGTSSQISSFSFDVTVSSGSIGFNNFVTNTPGYYFTADFGAANNTASGAISDPGIDPPSPAPEPSSLMLLGTGIVGAAGMLRRRLSNRS